MKTVKFDGYNYAGFKYVYECPEPGDQSGEYVRVDDAGKLTTTKTEWVVQSRPAYDHIFKDTIYVCDNIDRANRLVESARQIDSYEYRVIRRETLEFLEGV